MFFKNHYSIFYYFYYYGVTSNINITKKKIILKFMHNDNSIYFELLRILFNLYNNKIDIHLSFKMM